MKTNLEWEEDITTITLKIRKEYPELTKYISELPLNNSGDGQVNGKHLEDYYNTLDEIVRNYGKTHAGSTNAKNDDSADLPGYPKYEASQDIYAKGKEEKEIDPENLSTSKTSNENDGKRSENDMMDDMMGGDLDVPGSELDNAQEIIGNEDEENNYYSLGGDDHNDLEEDRS